MKILNRCELKKTLLALTLLISVVVNTNVEAAGFSTFANITKLQLSDGLLFVQLDTSKVSNHNGCPEFQGWHVFIKDTLDASQKSYKEFLSLVLTAFTLNKEISIFSNSCSSIGTPFPKGTSILIEP